MTDNFEIPEHLKGTYHRMLNRAPEQLRADGGFQHLTLLHLKVGGDRLARQNTELFRFRLEEEFIFGSGLLQDKDAGEGDPAQEDDLAEESDTLDSDQEDDDLDDDDDPKEDSMDYGSSAKAERCALSDQVDFQSFQDIWADGFKL